MVLSICSIQFLLLLLNLFRSAIRPVLAETVPVLDHCPGVRSVCSLSRFFAIEIKNMEITIGWAVVCYGKSDIWYIDLVVHCSPQINQFFNIKDECCPLGPGSLASIFTHVHTI